MNDLKIEHFNSMIASLDNQNFETPFKVLVYDCIDPNCESCILNDEKTHGVCVECYPDYDLTDESTCYRPTVLS